MLDSRLCGNDKVSSFLEISLALNAYQPLFDSTGELMGVFAVNISLNQLSDRLREIEVGDSGQVFILERDSQLIATSTPERGYTTIGAPDLRGVSELEHRFSIARNPVSSSGGIRDLASLE